MAEISISQLPSAGALSSSNLIDIVQSGGNRKATLGATAKFVNEDNIIVSDQLPPETCNSGDLENYNKGKVYIYKTQSIEQGYILENIEEDQNQTGVWNLVWYEIKDGTTFAELKTEIKKRELLEHYGTSDIVVTDESFFSFGLRGDNNDIPTLIGVKGDVELPQDVVLPYRCIIDGTVYDVEAIGGLLEQSIISVVIPKGVKYINDSAFLSNYIEEMVIPDGVASIDDLAFANCSQMKTIYLPISLTEIASYAFEECRGLETVYYEGSESDWKQITIGEAHNEYLLNANIYYNYMGKDAIKEAISEHNSSDEAHQDIRTTIGYIMHNMDISTFADVQQIVRQGFAKYVFKVGEQFIINESTGLSATIIDFDYDTPTDSRYTHSMTLQMTDLIYPRIPFSSPQAAWYIDGTAFPNGLESGQYWFTIDNDNSALTRNFTLTKTVPVGGIVCFNAGSNYFPYDNSTITTYASSNTTTPIESGIVIESGNYGTPIPSLQITPAFSYVNSLNRIVSGNNSWKDSYIRAYLNNTGTNWWSPQGRFDYKPTSIPTGYLSTFAGTDFLSVIGTVYKKTQKIAEDGYGIDTTSDKFFLLSRPEVYGGLERTGEDIPNEAYDYYGPGRSSLNRPGTGADSNRIKYTNNIALTYGLRTPVASNNYQVRTVFTNGSISETTGADAYLRFAPACVIY